MLKNDSHAARAGAVLSTDELTYREAAEITGLSVDTIKNDREAGKYAGAYQDRARRNRWMIPVTDLVNAGRLDASLVEQVATELAGLRESKELRELREELIRVTEQLAAERRRADELRTDKTRLEKYVDLLLKKAA